MEGLSRRIAELADECGADIMERFAENLRSGAISQNSDPIEIMHLLRPAVVQPVRLSALLTEWRNCSPPPSLEALNMAVKTAVFMKELCSPRTVETDFVWTGPSAGGSERLVSTIPVIRSMIDEAQRQILVVGYNLTVEATSTKTIIGALARASKRGCRITVAFHDNSSNYRILSKAWPSDVPAPRMLIWCGNPDSPNASLHAKLVSVDRNQVLVTSANLTRHGMEHNIEFGVRIRGAKAAQVEDHFSLLERKGFLMPLKIKNP
ncbi:hypothetical protein GTO91_16835 [Heliobacterium undosum]|uniref:phospholipase D n=1 Tax=Heliomicrobium undosum TaxID=121734 RepID=A0A845LCI2_9FIRM|nr:phospholipase D-like domain-containing protein [Heliomicrobium undosum]MZP31368.1 hypothetical protein [Heliomicrobium undosum]